jgi:hypothetical protein
MAAKPLFIGSTLCNSNVTILSPDPVKRAAYTHNGTAF